MSLIQAKTRTSKNGIIKDESRYQSAAGFCVAFRVALSRNMLHFRLEFAYSSKNAQTKIRAPAIKMQMHGFPAYRSDRI